MIGAARAGFEVSITGLGCKVPDRVVKNDELSQYVDTSDEWIVERTGIRERRIAAAEEALSDLATLSLVRRDPRSRGLSVHRLVQDVVRFTLTDEEQRDWAERVGHHLNPESAAHVKRPP